MMKLLTDCSFKGVKFYFPYCSFESEILRPNACVLTFSLMFVAYMEESARREE